VNRRVRSSKQLVEGSGQLAVGDSGKKSAGEDLACDLKTLCALQYSDIRSLFVALISVVQFGAVNCECRLGQRNTE
jgi:hypothetical protein